MAGSVFTDPIAAFEEMEFMVQDKGKPYCIMRFPDGWIRVKERNRVILYEHIIAELHPTDAQRDHASRHRRRHARRFGNEEQSLAQIRGNG